MELAEKVIELPMKRKRVALESLLYTAEQVAQLIGMSDRHVRTMCATEELRAVKIGRVWRIHREDFQAWLDAQRGLA